MNEGLYTKKLKADRVICTLCHHQCLIPPDSRGICRVRNNKKGKVYSLVYQKYNEERPEKIEEVPFFHYLPGSKSYFLGSIGENFKSVKTDDELEKELKDLKKVTADQAVKRAVKNECKSISYNHDEPIIFIENVLEIAKLAKSKKIKNLIKTNGYAYETAFKDLLKVIHAINFQLDSVDKDIFKRLHNAKLNYVLRNISLAIEKGTWIEITTDLILDMNDNEGEIRKIAEYIKSLGQIPWLINNADEQKEKLILGIAKDLDLKYVYVNNKDLLCPKCGKVVVDREKNKNHLVNKNKCEFCKKVIDGVF